MLVLSRKINEVICIGDNIEVQVLQIKGGTVRLGITAPREISVVRSEITGREVRQSPEVTSSEAGNNGENPVVRLGGAVSQPAGLSLDRFVARRMSLVEYAARSAPGQSIGW